MKNEFDFYIKQISTTQEHTIQSTLSVSNTIPSPIWLHINNTPQFPE